MESKKIEILEYKKSNLFYFLLYSSIFMTFIAVLLAVLDIFDIGTFRQQNALEASFVCWGWIFLVHIYLEYHNYEFFLNDEFVNIKSTSFFKKGEYKIYFNEIKKIEVLSITKEIKFYLDNGNRFLLRYMHKRTSGNLPNKTDVGNPQGSLRELMNLKNEIELRVKSVNS